MKSIYFHIPDWGNRWIPYIYDALKHHRRVTDPADADILFSAWCNEFVAEASHKADGRRIVTFCRRYEMYQPNIMGKINWPAVSDIIFVSEYARGMFNRMPHIPKEARDVRQHVIENGVDIDRFPFREEFPNSKKIAMIASSRWVKGYQLMAQILMCLPQEYKIHQIGLPGSVDFATTTMEYLAGLGLSDRFVPEGHIPSADVPGWLMDKDCLLSCSMSEGNPMNVIEAMAMGIQPVVHSWPGASEQFPPWAVFREAGAAATMIQRKVNAPSPESVRSWASVRFSLRNYSKLREIIN